MSTERETTLTTPDDRAGNFKIDTDVPPLSETETKEAMRALNRNEYITYAKAERRFADPVLDMQKIGLVSFVPAKGAKPNDRGIYGFAKIRGSFPNEMEANERAEFLIKNHDSYHQIYHCYVGRPFPLTTSSDYSREVSKVELNKQMAEAIGQDVKEKREKEQRDIEEIKKREQELLDDVKLTEENKDDRYTTLRVKKAQLVWTYLETEKKMHQMRGLIARARKEIEDMDESDPELKNKYYEKYMQARKTANLPVDKATADESFMKYLVEDVESPDLEAEYKRLYGDEVKRQD
jgi:hypothetical protein